ncbi:chitin synthase (macronuclear) [Tetrahymena thermophila SB210]|uniref:chitin synthase n=1 Tax=Tetrahymena thermophila (strain SB210) TaxID=312017 RepID=Q22RX4_TETTS|nr:chitin synthase [Tetrahymena thermophila SB210]EAR87998.1 chitin synthase [Tetrahymena thermophila SB210]|eukprot:XP_001008243.1 chitin synthase [Tetrahymena thermophila SB210]
MKSILKNNNQITFSEENREIRANLLSYQERSEDHEESKNNQTVQGNKTILYNPYRNTVDTTMINVEEFNSQKPLDVYLMTSFDEKGQQRKPGLLICKHPHLKLDKRTLSNQNNNKAPKYDKQKKYYPTFDEETGYQGRLFPIDTETGKHGLLSYYSKQVKGFDKIKMLVCVTMYAEERAFLENTLRHIYNNIEFFEKEAGVHQSQIAVVVLQDGIMKMRQETVDFYSHIDESLKRPCHLQNRRNIIDQQIKFLKYTKQEATLESNQNFPNTIPAKTTLLYQNQIQFNDLNELKVNLGDQNFDQNHMDTTKSGLIVFSAFKHLNSKKLSSHLWFFEGFCQQFKPKYCALVDVGTLPAKDGLVKFYMALEGNDKIGGVCGFLGLEEPQIGEEKSEREMMAIQKEAEKKIKEQKRLIRDEWQDQKKEKKQNQKTHIQQKVNQEDDQKQKSEEIRIEKLKRIKDTKNKVNLKIQLILFPITLLYIIFKKILFDFIIYNIFWFIFKIIQYTLLGFLRLGSLKNAQLYEYTIAHMVDKNFESLLGFLHVLPGAWSAYRYEALQVKFEGRETILQKAYFKQLLNPRRLEGNIYEANMFLAEDRILCLGLYCQPQKDYILKYIPDAYAFTDPVGTLEEFMSQRRRWINSTNYALDYVLKHYRGFVEDSGHTSLQKKIILPFNMFFAALGKFNTYMLPAFYIFVAIMCSYQFLNPDLQQGYQLYVDENKTEKCQQMDTQPDDQMCNPLVELKKQTLCYQICTIKDDPSFALIALNLIPAIFIVCILCIIFASLVLKVKGGNKQLYNKIIEQSLEDHELNEIGRLRNELEQKLQDERSRNAAVQKIRKIEIQYEKKIHDIKERKGNYTIRELQEIKQESIHTLKTKKFELKKLVDQLKTQEFGMTVFKVLSAIISVSSLLIAGIVLVSVALNIYNRKNNVIVGFKELDNTLYWYIIALLATNVASYVIIAVVHICPQYKLVWFMFKSWFSFTIYQPIYNHVLLIYAFCNVDDVTWGTKGIGKDSEKTNFYLNKVQFVGKWLLLNAVFVTLLISVNLFFAQTPYVMLGIGTYGTSYLAIKSILAAVNYLRYFCYEKKKYYKKVTLYNTNFENPSAKAAALQEFEEFRLRGGRQYRESNLLQDLK